MDTQDELHFAIDGINAGALYLKHAVLLYEGNHNRGPCMATIHDVASIGGALTILEGKSMTTASAFKLAARLTRARQLQGFLPISMLCIHADLMLWWVPPARRLIAFKSEVLGTRSASVPLPGLVFAAGTGVWRVWAIKGSERPGPDSALYQAPFFNVWKDGSICQGTVRIPEGACSDQIEAWNDAFFSSYFTHVNTGDAGLVQYEGGANSFWRDMLDGCLLAFPEQVLLDRHCALSTMIANLTGATDD